MRITDAWGAWNRFFFAPAPVETIACFRIAFGLLLLVEAAYLLVNVNAYLGPDGLVRYGSYVRESGGRAMSLFLYMPPTTRSVALIMGVHVAAVTSLTIGLLTPLSALVTFVTLRSIINRNPPITNGGDNVARIMCFLLIFSPAGHAWSVDHLLFAGHLGHGGMSAPWAQRLMQIQLSLIYVRAGYWKLRGVTYRRGTALYYVGANETDGRFPLPRVLLHRQVLRAATWGALALELALGPGLWIEELRGTFVALGVLLHLAIEYLVDVHLFGWFMIASLLLFVDPSHLPFLGRG